MAYKLLIKFYCPILAEVNAAPPPSELATTEIQRPTELPSSERKFFVINTFLCSVN